jgi:methylmalonyl-CoA mutase N-terminal domain/subunit
MLTSAEKHFIQSWKEQREEPRWKYSLQYIIVWSTVSFISLLAINNENLFEELMETVKVCSLGQITHALYEVGGQYRRNM